MNNDERKIPPALNIYIDGCELLLQLEMTEIGNVVKAAIQYYIFGEMPDGLSRLEGLAFTTIKGGIDRSAKTYQERCERNKKAAEKRWNEEE